MNAPFWLSDPNVLFNKNKITEIWPTTDMQFSEKLNAITRLVIALTFVGSFSSNKSQIILTGMITIVCIAMLFYFKTKKNRRRVLCIK